jgi:hypothetical protein
MRVKATISSKAPRGRSKTLDLPSGYKAQSFVRVRQNGQLAIPAALDGGLAWAFQLADVPDFADFANLYDAYVIDKVEVHYIVENTSPGQFPVLMYAMDYDDASTPLTDSQVSTHQGVKIFAFDEGHRHHVLTVKPRALNAAFKPGVTSAYTWAPEGVICDMANTDIQHYGIKTWVSHYNAVDTPQTRIRTYLRYFIRCIGQR